MSYDGHVHGPRHPFDRHVVVGRPHSARGENQVELSAEGRHLPSNLLHVVSDDRDTPHVHAKTSELAAEVGSIRVDDLPGQDLVTDEDDSRARHRWNSTSLRQRAGEQSTPRW